MHDVESTCRSRSVHIRPRFVNNPDPLDSPTPNISAIASALHPEQRQSPLTSTPAHLPSPPARPEKKKKMYRLRRAPLPRLRTGAPPRTNHRSPAAALSSASSRRSPQPRPFCSQSQPQFSPRPRPRALCSFEGIPATSPVSRLCPISSATTRKMTTSPRRRIGEFEAFPHRPRNRDLTRRERGVGRKEEGR